MLRDPRYPLVGVQLLILFGGCGRVERSPDEASGGDAVVMASGGTTMVGDNQGGSAAGGFGGSVSGGDAGAPIQGEEFVQLPGGPFPNCAGWQAELSWDKQSCVVRLPAPPPGQPFDPNRLNLLYAIEGGSTFLIRLAQGEPCSRGWRLSAASEIELCVDTCAAMASWPDGTLELMMGCEVVPIPPD